MLWKIRNPQRSIRSVPHPCRPTLAVTPPSGPGWVHEVKHDGYRAQVHLAGGRVRLFAMNGADWTERYPLIVAEAVRFKQDAILDCEVICTDE